MAGGLREAPPKAVAAATWGLPARTRSRAAGSSAAPASEQEVSLQDPMPRRQRRRMVVQDFRGKELCCAVCLGLCTSKIVTLRVNTFTA
jgi:hypothetical protein